MLLYILAMISSKTYTKASIYYILMCDQHSDLPCIRESDIIKKRLKHILYHIIMKSLSLHISMMESHYYPEHELTTCTRKLNVMKTVPTVYRKQKQKRKQCSAHTSTRGVEQRWNTTRWIPSLFVLHACGHRVIAVNRVKSCTELVRW